MSWLALCTIRRVSLRPTLFKNAHFINHYQKRLISVTRTTFASDLIPQIYKYTDLINNSRRSARTPHENELKSLITANSQDPQLATLFTEIANKGEASPFLNIIANTNPEQTAKFLCQLDPQSLSKLYFDIQFSQLCQILENVIKMKPIQLSPTIELSENEIDAENNAILVPHHSKVLTWEDAFYDFAARHIIDEVLIEELDDKVSNWIVEQVYPIVVKQNKDTFDFKLNGFVPQLIGSILARAAITSNWDDNLLANHLSAMGKQYITIANLYTTGGNVLNFLKEKKPDLSFEERARIWVSLVIMVSHKDQILKKKKSAVDVRVIQLLINESTKTWTYSERIELDPLVTRIIEPRGSVFAFIQQLRNLIQ